MTLKLEDDEDDDDEAVIIEDTQVCSNQTGSTVHGLLPSENISQINSQMHFGAELIYGSDSSSRHDPVRSEVGHPSRGEMDRQSTDDLGYAYNPKRRRISLARGNSAPPSRAREPEYEDRDEVIYEYDPDYDCASIASEGSYSGDQQRTLTDILNYCQLMYDAIQKLDKKFDLLHRKVLDMQHVHLKPVHLKHRPLTFSHRGLPPLPLRKVRIQKALDRDTRLQLSSPSQEMHAAPLRVRLRKESSQNSASFKIVQPSQPSPPVPPSTAPVLPPSSPPVSSNLELHQPQYGAPVRQSPPLPTIISTHSLRQPVQQQHSLTSRIAEIPQMPKSVDSMTMKSPSSALPSSVITPVKSNSGVNNFLEKCPLPVSCRASPDPSVPVTPALNEELPSSSSSANIGYEYVGNPKRNIKIPGNYLMKARQKNKPKYAARYLVRALFSKETLLCSNMLGDSTRGLKALDPNRVGAIREFLNTVFPSYDLCESDREWKACITNVNAMIRCLRCEAKRGLEHIETSAKSQEQDATIFVDLDSDGEETSVVSQDPQDTSASTTGITDNPSWERQQENVPAPGPDNQQGIEALECLGNPWRNVHVPFSVMYVAKRKARPELAARYLIRHIFPEDVLIKSNVYGHLERGIEPLDCNRIGALRDFLEKNYPSFDLNEGGHDWRACVAAINSSIRSLRHDQRKAAGIAQRKGLHPLEQPFEMAPTVCQSPSGDIHGNKTINISD
ncbi:BEN domain-containing protein 2 [Protopterus annectens]|uniref:BEN domain-containing protein 2 n=1 Tax=Protopterus annectens TaxID=7888 RepID=UPI001CFA9627|nr:BEN domain-containing protein 2 [Protopterus annectens]